MEGNDSNGGRPLYRPYRWAAADFQVGLRPIKPNRWILIDSGHEAIMREKRERLSAFPTLYYRTLPGSLAAQQELCERVIAHLVTDYPEHFERTGPLVRSRATGVGCDLTDHSIEPLRQLSDLIEEDFMLIQEIDGAPRITAASRVRRL